MVTRVLKVQKHEAKVKELSDLLDALEIPDDFRIKKQNIVRSNVDVRAVLDKIRELKLQIKTLDLQVKNVEKNI